MYASVPGPRNQPPDGPQPHLPDPHRPGGEPGPHLSPFEDPREEPRRGEPDRPPREPNRGARRFARAALIAAPLTLVMVSAAAAESCEAQLERFARQYDLATTAPQARLREGDPVTPPSAPMTAESRGLSTTDKLKDSGGVIEPPDTGAARVMPPPQTGDRMATAPKVEPQAGSGQSAGSSQQMGAADRSKLESLLMAGRDAAERGDEQGCMQRLGEARGLLAPNR